jgi:hypothetical protein
MKANCVNSTQHSINNYMKTMGTKRTLKKNKRTKQQNKNEEIRGKGKCKRLI